MATVHKTYRIDEALAARMAAYAEAEGLKAGEAANAIIAAGLEALERTAEEAAQGGAEAVSDVGGATTPEDMPEGVEALISSLQRQLETKDEQIATLMRLQDQGQQLQAAQAQQIKALLPGEAEGGKIVKAKPTWRQRLGAWIAGEGR